jgi:hypothetical protein
MWRSMSSPVAVVVTLVLPHGPDDAGQLVVERDRRFVVTDALFRLYGPAPQPIEFLALFERVPRRRQSSAGSVDQLRPQIYITPLADSSNTPFFPEENSRAVIPSQLARCRPVGKR